MYHILICDDEQDIVNALKIYLSSPDFKLFEANTGVQALEVMEREDIHLILLDIMMPEMDGISAMVKIRERSNVPVILITAKSEDSDKVLGLNVGADDYITKPFNILEVKARIKAITRRTTKSAKQKKDAAVIKASDMTLDTDSKRLHIGDHEINLTSKEFDVLELLVKNPDKVYSREKLLQLVWGSQYPGDVRTVDVHIRRLREKIETNPSDPKYVHTKWGVGYYFKG